MIGWPDLNGAILLGICSCSCTFCQPPSPASAQGQAGCSGICLLLNLLLSNSLVVSRGVVQQAHRAPAQVQELVSRDMLRGCIASLATGSLLVQAELLGLARDIIAHRHPLSKQVHMLGKVHGPNRPFAASCLSQA